MPVSHAARRGARSSAEPPLPPEPPLPAPMRSRRAAHRSRMPMGGSTPGARSPTFHLTRLSRQQRILVAAGMACLLAAAGFVSYRWYMRPTTLTVAVGSQDGEAPKLVAAIAAHLAQTGAPVRLSMKETP